MDTTANEACYREATAKPASERPKDGRSNPMKSGTYTLIRGVRRLERRGLKVIDRRTATGKALTRWRTALIDDLGGPEAVCTAQVQLVDLACRTKLIVDSVDGWLVNQRRLVNQKRALYPVVLQRQQLADSLARYLGQLGLERRARPLPDLATYLAEKAQREQQSENQHD